MTWKQHLPTGLANWLRLCMRAAVLLDAIILALASTYVIAKLALFTVRYLDRVWFSGSW